MNRLAQYYLRRGALVLALLALSLLLVQAARHESQRQTVTPPPPRNASPPLAAAPVPVVPVAAPWEIAAVIEQRQSVLASGGGQTNGGAFTQTGTIGQGVLGVASGGGFTATSGFWLDSVPAQLAFGAQPANAVAGASMPAFTVRVLDDLNNLVTNSNATITLALGANPTTATLGGTVSVAAVNGVATFNAVSVSKAGAGYTITASSNGLPGTTSNAFNVTCPTAATFPATLPNGTGGATYNASVAASPSGTYSYSVTGNFPNGLLLDPNTGAITGAPTLAGSFNFTITATRYGSCAASQTYTVVIACPTVDVLPKPTGPSPTLAFALPAARVGQSYTTTISANPTGGNYNFSVLAPGFLPNGLTLNPNTGVISGAPTVTGNFSFRMQATGFGSCSGSRAYSIRVNATSFAAARTRTVSHDFDGDGRSDLYRYEAGRWTIQRSSDGAVSEEQFGAADEPDVAADYDGDGRTDLAVWQAASGRWLIKQSSDGQLREEQFGAAEDAPVPADYDGDGRTDLALWQAATGSWLIKQSGAQTVQAFSFGGPDELPVVEDYDGDGKADLALFRPADGRWQWLRSAGGVVNEDYLGVIYAAQAGDLPLPGDYDGDGRADLLVFQPVGGLWLGKLSGDGQPFGERLKLRAEMLLPGDYDGDGKLELAAWLAAEGRWFVRRSNAGALAPQQ